MDAWTAVARALIASAFAIVVSSFATEGDSETSITKIDSASGDSETSMTKIDSVSGDSECAIATLTTMNSYDRTVCGSEIVNFATTISFVEEAGDVTVINLHGLPPELLGERL